MKRFAKLTVPDVAVVAMLCIIAAALLIPVCGHARGYSRQTVCMVNLRALSQGWVLYTEDNDGALVNGNCGQDSWVDRPQDSNNDPTQLVYTGHDSTLTEKINGIKAGKLYTYVGEAAMYHCPSDERYKVPVRSRGVGAYRTYSVPDGIINRMNRTWTISGLGRITGFDVYDEIEKPADKYVFVEENYTHSPGRPATMPPDAGYNPGTWSFWRADESDAWWDPVGAWHDDGMNLGFADGHAEYRRWLDERTVWFANDRFDPRLGSSTFGCAFQPNNPDQEYMTEHYPFQFVD